MPCEMTCHMPRSSKKTTAEDLLARGWKAIDDSRDYLKEFFAIMSAFDKRQDEFDRTRQYWELPTKKAA
jgi:hypothetical protein